MVDRYPRLREQLRLVVVPGSDRAHVRVSLHTKLPNPVSTSPERNDLRNKSSAQFVPVGPRLLRSVPNVPLVDVTDCWVTSVLAAIRTAAVVVDIGETTDNFREDDFVDMSPTRRSESSYKH